MKAKGGAAMRVFDLKKHDQAADEAVDYPIFLWTSPMRKFGDVSASAATHAL